MMKGFGMGGRARHVVRSFLRFLKNDVNSRKLTLTLPFLASTNKKNITEKKDI